MKTNGDGFCFASRVRRARLTLDARAAITCDTTSETVIQKIFDEPPVP